MDRSEVFYQFMQKHPAAQDQQFDLGKKTVGEVRLGMLHDIVDEVFIAAYFNDGKRRMEHRIQEPELSAAVGALRVMPEAALALGLAELRKFVG